MSCCSDKSCGAFFSERMARRDARRYRRKGLDATAHRIVGFLRNRGMSGRSVLEVGGGVGAIELELLKAGADRAVNVELSAAYEQEARTLFREHSLEERMELRVLDFAERASEIEPADAVVLHRVVCCYPDYEALLGAAAERARHWLVFSFPRETWWTRLGAGAINLVQRVRRHEFRSYVHPPAALFEVARRHGLRLVEEHERVVWRMVAFERA